jgi:putative ABC transport system permease protein
MIRNYITVALRNLNRHRTYSTINIVGLGIGVCVCVCILAIAYVRYELSYDTHAVNRDRTFRVLWSAPSKNIVTTGTSGPLAQALKETFPEIVETARARRRKVWVIADEASYPQRVCMADPSLLRMFDLPLVRGKLDEVLVKPFSLVITESTAKQWFGAEDPIGKQVTVESLQIPGTYTVTGVLRDLPQNMSEPFRFDILTPPHRRWKRWLELTTSTRHLYTFVQLRSPNDAPELHSKLQQFLEQKFGAEKAEQQAYHLQPASDWHLDGKKYGLSQGMWDGDPELLFLVSGIAFLVIAVACINFVNLSTARATTRELEVGVRKTLGASRQRVFSQFALETFTLTALAVLFGTGLAEVFFPMFQTRLAPTLPESMRPVLWALPYLPLLLVGTTVLAGIYPAFYLSLMEPSRVTQKVSTGDPSRGGLRRALVLIQFATCILLVGSTWVMREQVDYLLSRDLGFDRDLHISMPIFDRDRARKPDWGKHLSYRYRNVKARLLEHTSILKASAYWIPPGTHAGYNRLMEVAGTRAPIKINEVDEDFLDTFGIGLVAGRNFRITSVKGISGSRKDRQYLINETAARHFGWSAPTDAVGQTFHLRDSAIHRDGVIVGVVQDYNSGSLKNEIEPLALFYSADAFSHIGITVRPEGLSKTVAFLRETWEQLLPERPFEYAFLDDRIANLYQRQVRSSRMIGDFSLVAILLGCFGLFGLASFTVERKRKEIGIRKVMGASVGSITKLLTKESAAVIILANVVAWPIGYYLMSTWLESFPYRIDLHIGFFAAAGAVTLLIAVGTVAYQAVRAARLPPVESIRDD